MMIQTFGLVSPTSMQCIFNRKAYHGFLGKLYVSYTSSVTEQVNQQ